MDTVKIHDGIGYAPNPHYKRGAPKVSVHQQSLFHTQIPNNHPITDRPPP